MIMKSIAVKIKYTIVALLVCLLGAISVTLASAYSSKAEAVLEGADDVFELIETSCDADEGFVFSATANFESGNAAGLVFGATEDKSYWVFNVDRPANLVKLMYFDYSSGKKVVHDIKKEEYVGSKLMNDGERGFIQGLTSNIDKVYLMVAVTPTDDGKVYAEFYADGIRRFCYVDGSEEALKIDLNALSVGEDENKIEFTYGGGQLGYNCFNAKVRFTDEEIGETDSSYSEIYRNQYHFSQYAHWNNDPNGLVYYKGYYHVYYQHNPFGNLWGNLSWGHARSKDLLHWEQLPVAIVPDRDLAPTVPVPDDGYDHWIGTMWSGSARVYHKGDSDKIDNEYKWFGDVSDKAEGEALGLIGVYTRDNALMNDHQILMYSTDGGLSWHKSVNIPNTTSLNRDGTPVTGGDWRDPKIFDISGIEGNNTDYKWGMVLTDMGDNTMFFIKSKNLVEWEHAGCYEVFRPECPDLITLNDGTRNRTVITFTSRYYVICDLVYEDGNIVMKDENGETIDHLLQGNPQFRTIDYGPDSYAAQAFYIDDDSDSAYKGKHVAINWFSGVPGAENAIDSGVLQTARKTWNGGGMTIPVIYGLDGETLTVTPITVEDAEFEKLRTPWVNISGAPMTDGLLDSVKSRTAEIVAKLSNPARADVSFKVNMSADGEHYTEIGWNRREGYFVDRTHTDDGGIIFPQPNYARRHASGMGKNNTVLDFYILVDRNNVEVYCDDFSVPFYLLTFASPYSENMSFTSTGDLNIIELKVNTIASTWRENDDSLLFVSDTNIELSTSLTVQKEITVVSGGEAEYEIVSGSDVAELTENEFGFTVKALAAGNAVIRVTSGEKTKLVDVTVHSGLLDSQLTFSDAGIVSGNWIVSGTTLIGEQLGGDGFILSDERGADFIYSASFDLGSGAAAALVFRAEAAGNRLQSYIIANYDRNGNVVKLWTQNREIARANYTPADVHDITLTAFVEGDRVKISINGTDVIDATLDEKDPTRGRFGLNACATRAVFKTVETVLREYEYSSGSLEIGVGNNTRIDRIVNKTLANTEVAAGFYSFLDGRLIIDETYLSILPEKGVYLFAVSGDKLSVNVTVNVTDIPECSIIPVTVTTGNDATVFIGKRSTDYVKVNGTAIRSTAYSVSNYTLRLDGDVLTVGSNTVVLSDGTEFTVSVLNKDNGTISVYIPPVPLNFKPFAIGAGVTGGIILLCVVALIVLVILAGQGKLTLRKPFADRTAAIRRRNFGLIVAACIVGPIALFLAVCALTAPMGNIALWVLTAAALVFGYPYAAQLMWNGKLYKSTVSPMKSMGTPKEIFDVDKECNKFMLVLRYIGAAFKTLWLCIRILLCGVISLIRAPFLFVGQVKAVTYGEFGFSNRAESAENSDTVNADTEIGEEA